MISFNEWITVLASLMICCSKNYPERHENAEPNIHHSQCADMLQNKTARRPLFVLCFCMCDEAMNTYKITTVQFSDYILRKISTNACEHPGTWSYSWLRQCATSRKVTGSILDMVFQIFHWLNPSGRTMVLGSTLPLTETSTRDISGGVKAAEA